MASVSSFRLCTCMLCLHPEVKSILFVCLFVFYSLGLALWLLWSIECSLSGILVFWGQVLREIGASYFLLFESQQPYCEEAWVTIRIGPHGAQWKALSIPEIPAGDLTNNQCYAVWIKPFRLCHHLRIHVTGIGLRFCVRTKTKSRQNNKNDTWGIRETGHQGVPGSLAF